MGEKIMEVYHPQVLIDNQLQAATLEVLDGKIADLRIGKKDDYQGDLPQSGILMPGLVDIHVHVNEPGNTDWEGFDNATKAAAAGGITSIVDMPLNSIPVTTNVAAFEQKLEAARKNLHVNVGFWGGVVPGNHADLKGLVDAGVLGFKAFMVHSGLDEFPNSDRQTLARAMYEIADAGLPLLAHCEVELEEGDDSGMTAYPRSHDAWMKSRPQKMEIDAISQLLELCIQTRCRAHVVHLSASEALPMLEIAMLTNAPFTIETAPHYLLFANEQIEDGAVQYKCAPPIREAENARKLLEAVESGLITMIGTDHSPAPPSLKALESGDFTKAWGGIASLQLLLPAMWTVLQKSPEPLALLNALCITKPYEFIGQDKQKGKIAEGYDADFVIWEPQKSFVVAASDLHFRHKETCPYIGRELQGKVLQTYVNGKLVYSNDSFIELNAGKLILNGK